MEQEETLGERVIRLGRLRADARERAQALSNELGETIRQAINAKVLNESTAARAAGVDRMTVRAWIGK